MSSSCKGRDEDLSKSTFCKDTTKKVREFKGDKEDVAVDVGT